MEGGVQEVEAGEGDRRVLISEPALGDGEDSERSQREYHRLANDQGHGAGEDNEERGKKIQDRGEVITPCVHLRKAHIGTPAVGDVREDLSVVPQVQGVGSKGVVPADRDEGKDERIGYHPDSQCHTGRKRRERGWAEPPPKGQHR